MHTHLNSPLPPAMSTITLISENVLMIHFAKSISKCALVCLCDNKNGSFGWMSLLRNKIIMTFEFFRMEMEDENCFVLFCIKSPLCTDKDPLERKRLLKKIIGAHLGGLYRGFNGAVAGDHDHR